MMKKIYCLTEQALSVLKMPEVKLRLMLFFEVTDARTIESYLAANLPNGPLMNFCVKEIILEYAPYLKDKIYRRLSQEEADALNKTKNELKKKYGEGSQNN
ncbi:MAG: hypothetical protein MJZ76_08195 [Bacteroidales bacterium]|nr:hypothetical protein [Bacteroidales bacterium]